MGCEAITPQDRFTEQGFILWDYLIGVDNDGLPAHFDDLIALCQRRKVQRVIVFIKDPSSFSFFQLDSDEGFIAKANGLTGEGINLSVFFETGDFSSSAPALKVPTVNPPPSSKLEGYFADIQPMLDWAAAVSTKVPGISEIAFDPQAAGATSSIEQLVYNYSDEYKFLNGLDKLRLATSLGIDESKECYANTYRFPVPTIFTAHITTFPTAPTWNRGSDPSAPLLGSVYIQCYQTSIPAIFESHDGVSSGKMFNALLRDQPYVNGAGTISFTKHTTAVDGQGTKFKALADPFLYAQDKKIGVVSGATSDEELTLEEPGADFTGEKLPFTRTEVVTAWDTQPELTQEVVDSIYWMFSVNYKPPLSFFGNWQLLDFMDFIDSATAANKQTSPFGSCVFPEKNFVIYNYNYLTTVTDWNL